VTERAESFDAEGVGGGTTGGSVEASGASRALALIERLLLVAGTILFFVLLYRVGPAKVWENLRHMGWGFIPVLGQELVAILLNTRGWRWSFPPPRPAIRYTTLVAARLAGDAINNLTPTATVGGEVIRVRMVEGQVGATNAWASVAIARIAHTTAQILFIVIGLAVVLGDTPLPHGVRRGLYIFLALLSTGVGLAVILQRRGMFVALASAAQRIGLRLPSRFMASLATLDKEVVRFYREPRAFLTAASFFFLGWLMGVVEVRLILYFLDVEAGWHVAIMIEVLAQALDAALFFVPARAGTQEGGIVLIFTLLGLPPVKGLAMAIIRRLRQLSWALAGLVVLSRRRAQLRRVADEAFP
jgi:putative membrane protein